jgi:GntR family transcriptional regulator, transcriptional repressor for pyruvate dehydrogenase complex
MDSQIKKPKPEGQPTATQSIFEQMLTNVNCGDWKVGASIPSERTLIHEFGVSRIAVREALSMLRGLGILDVGHGRRSVIRKIDSETFGQFFPLMLSGGGQRTFDQVFEVRIAIESRTAYLAAQNRSEQECQQLTQLAKAFRDQMLSGDPRSGESDLKFHLAVAKMTQNPLFSTLLEALLGFVSFVQKESCKDDPQRGQRAIAAHEAIAEAIAQQDAERAQVEMEAHLRFSATRKLSVREPLN